VDVVDALFRQPDDVFLAEAVEVADVALARALHRRRDAEQLARALHQRSQEVLADERDGDPHGDEPADRGHERRLLGDVMEPVAGAHGAAWTRPREPAWARRAEV
jgi:hypothetical protein